MSVDNVETGELVNSVNYEIHPVAALFPYIEGEAFREFVEDISANGQREPVVLDRDGRLIDGRNRARACNGWKGLVQRAASIKDSHGVTQAEAACAAVVEIYNSGRGGVKLMTWWAA